MKTFLDKHKEAIKRIVLLPNVLDYKTETIGLHDTALLYGIEKIIRTTRVTQLNEGSYNKYLEKQLQRLSKYAVQGEIEKYLWLSTLMMKHSVSFRLKFMNEVDNKWYLRKAGYQDILWRRISKLCKTDSSNLKFKRVWITDPGKTETYTRPLGVPTLEWRIFSRMKVEILERYLKGRGLLRSWQHGGRSGKGVLSCYKSLMPKMIRSPNIMEFDIKGFFNHISHEKIVDTFTEIFGKKVSKWIKRILTKKPISYTLPPKMDDKAYQEYIRSLRFDYKDVGGTIWFDLGILDIQMEIWRKENPLLTRLGKTYLLVRDGEYWLRNGSIDSDRYRMDDDVNNSPITLDNVYKMLMNDGHIGPETFTFERDFEPNEESRAMGRDNWKDLALSGKGVPQGLGTSPLLSTFMTDVYLSPLGKEGNLIMYMDDGLLFSEDNITAKFNELKERLSTLGLEVAPEKCKIIRENGEWKSDTKFLGLKYLWQTRQLMSDTRSGTKQLFPEGRSWGEIAKAALESGITDLSNVRNKYEQFIFGKELVKSWEAGIRTGFLGTLISKAQYKGGKSDYLRKLEIEDGKTKAWQEALKHHEGLMWNDIQQRKITLTNLSSIAVENFLTAKAFNLTIRRYSRIKYLTPETMKGMKKGHSSLR